MLRSFLHGFRGTNYNRVRYRRKEPVPVRVNERSSGLTRQLASNNCGLPFVDAFCSCLLSLNLQSHVICDLKSNFFNI